MRVGLEVIGLVLVCVLSAGCGVATVQSTQAAMPAHNEGMGHLRAGRHRAAVASFDRALASNPRMGASLRGRGDAHLAMGNHDAAIADYTKFVGSGSTTDYVKSWAYIHRAEAHYAKGDYDRAWADVNRARAGGLVIERDPKLSVFLRRLQRASGRQR